MSARRHLATAGLAFGSVLAAAGPAVAQAPVRPAHEAAHQCRVAGSKLVPIRLPGNRRVYVEPQAFAAARQRLLLAGQPSYLWRAANSGLIRDTSTAVFGAVMDAEGHGTIVPPPMDVRRIRDVRALGRRDGRWDVTFAEVAPVSDEELAKSRGEAYWSAPVLAYWFGVTDGATWHQLVKLPAVKGRLNPGYASAIVETARTTAVAMPFRHDAAGPVAPGHTRAKTDAVVVFSLTDGRWRSSIIPGRHKIPGHYVSYVSYISYVALGPSPSGGLLLGMIRSDETLTHGETPLFLFERAADDTAWRNGGRIILDSTKAYTRPPEFALNASGLVVSFLKESAMFGAGRGRALFRPDTGDTKFLTVATNVEEFHQVATDGMLRGWVSMDAPPSADAGGTLRVHRYEGDALVSTNLKISPFTSLILGAAMEDKTFIVGPIPDLRATHGSVRSSLVVVDWRYKADS